MKSPFDSDLDVRARHLLRTLIAQYLVDGEPVGSRTLARSSGLEVSPATIRNIMADLEEAGLVASPHTSAGRIPTPRGLRLFVDSLIELQAGGWRGHGAPARAAATGDHPRSARQCLDPAFGDDPFRRRGHRAPAGRLSAAAYRFRQPARRTRAGDPGVLGQPGAEPRDPAGPAAGQQRAGAGGQLPQQQLRRLPPGRHPLAPAR